MKRDIFNFRAYRHYPKPERKKFIAFQIFYWLFAIGLVSIILYQMSKDQ